MEFDFSPIADNWRFFASGLGVTVALSLISAVTSILAGLVIALLRLYGPGWLRPVLIFYIDSMRAIPVLVVLVWMYFAFPLLVGFTFAPFWAAVIALTLHIAAYAAERFVNSPPIGDEEKHHNVRVGWAAGAGVEYAFAPHWTARLEYLHNRFEGANIRLASGTQYSSSLELQSIRVGLNRKLQFDVCPVEVMCFSTSPRIGRVLGFGDDGLNFHPSRQIFRPDFDRSIPSLQAPHPHEYRSRPAPIERVIRADGS